MILCMLFSVTAPQESHFLRRRNSVLNHCRTILMAAVGVMKKGMSMSLFSSPGNTVVSGQPCAGKTNLTVELITAVVESNKKGEG